MVDTYIIWLTIAGILLIVEMLSFSTYALWIAIGAGLTGLTAFLLPSLNPMAELFIFAFFSIIGFFVGLKFFSSNKIQKTNENILNQRGNQYLNQIYTLEEDVVNGRAYLKISDTIWRIECKFDLKQNTKVRVIAVHGNILIVEPYIF